MRLGFHSVFLLCIVSGDCCAKFVKSHMFAFVRFFSFRFGCQNYLLSEVAICFQASCKYEIPESLKGNNVNGCVNRFLGGCPVLERPSALPTPKCQEFSLGSHV